MKHRAWRIGASIDAAVAAGGATLMTWLDWRLNPAGLFRGPSGTVWSVIWETWSSWFLPLFGFAAVLVVPFLLWRVRRARALLATVEAARRGELGEPAPEWNAGRATRSASAGNLRRS